MMSTTKESTSNLRKNWFIISSLVSKDFKLKYRRSALGVVWSVLNPLLMMIVLSAVFSMIFRFDVEHFPVYLILGQTIFSFMTESTQGAMRSIIDSSSLIKKIRIEKLLFPTEKVLFALLNFAISLIAVVIVMVFFQIIPTVNILFLPLLLFYVFLFSLGLGLILSTLAVFFRDVIHIWGVITTAWMYATPIIYPISILPEAMMTFMQFNPMYYYVTYFREITMWGMTPGLMENLICLGCGIVSLIIGLVVFRKNEKKFILYV